ncbi:nuclear transport factor 2 family protein [Candidatus Bathyarchaeota archaeon]|nr:MAG: nuclear transport factor 2 family protein [Candidatus Bathyarchaeota archaeon]
MISIEEVHAAEEMWAQAHLKTDALERLMHPDFTIIKPDGTIWEKKETDSGWYRIKAPKYHKLLV